MATNGQTAPPQVDIPINFAVKYADVNVNRAIQIEPNKKTIILINLTKNIITPVK